MLVRCEALQNNCGLCTSVGCSYCLVSSMELHDPMFLSAAQQAAQQASTDYACISGSCENLKFARPATQYFALVPPDQCSTVQLPAVAVPTIPIATSLAPQASGNPDASGLAQVQTRGNPDVWPYTWGPLQWLAISAPVSVLCLTCCGIWMHSRMQRQKLRRVHVEPAPMLGVGGVGAALWDFRQAGPLSPEQVEGAAMAITDAEKAAAVARHMPSPRRLAFGVQNGLTDRHLHNLGELLDAHPVVSVSLDMEWRNAEDHTLEELAKMLRRRGRCELQAVIKKGAENHLRLPMRASPATLAAVGESVAVAGHSVVDAICLEATETATTRTTPATVVDLASLRLSPQELKLSRQRLGDAGCATACGFARPWAGRLVAVRMLECDIGDAGAAELTRLLLGEPERRRNPLAAGVAANLRELVLSANRIGDRGIATLADALPKCDALERLLIDRNCIGPSGAAALAKRLPRSNIKELVLGSHLGGNPLGPVGVEALAAALGDELERAAADRATRLEALALEDCAIGIRGAKALAAALPCSGVSALSLARGDLGDAGAAYVLDALPPGFLSLDLAGNGISDALVPAVGQACRRMPLLNLSLAQNELSPYFRERLREAHGQRLRV